MVPYRRANEAIEDDHHTKPSATQTDTRKIRNLIEELSREEHGLGIPLLDAAVAGVILGFKPADREMRTQAQQCWETLKPRLNRHLLSEDETVLPLAEGAGGISSVAMDRIKKSHLEMRWLIGTLVGASFEEDPDKVVSVAGKVLCALAVKARRLDRQRGNAPATGTQKDVVRLDSRQWIANPKEPK